MSLYLANEDLLVSVKLGFFLTVRPAISFCLKLLELHPNLSKSVCSMPNLHHELTHQSKDSHILNLKAFGVKSCKGAMGFWAVTKARIQVWLASCKRSSPLTQPMWRVGQEPKQPKQNLHQPENPFLQRPFFFTPTPTAPQLRTN